MRTMKKAQQKSEIELAVDAYLAEIGVSYSVVPRGTGLKRDGWECDGWAVAFQKGNGRKTFEEFDYFTGTGHRVDHGPGYQRLKGEVKSSLSSVNYQKNHAKPFAPFAASVLYCLILDAHADDMSFSNWCGDYGYGTDSRKAFETYQACCNNAAKLRKVFTHNQIEKLFDLLQDF